MGGSVLRLAGLRLSGWLRLSAGFRVALGLASAQLIGLAWIYLLGLAYRLIGSLQGIAVSWEFIVTKFHNTLPSDPY